MAPPVFKFPPPKNKAQASQQTAFSNYIKAHAGMAQFAQGIWQAAKRYNVDPVYFASLLWHEGFAEAKRRGVPVATIRSPAGAIGPGQIMPLHIGSPVPWAPGKTVTQKDLETPAFNIRWSAYYFGQKLAAAGGNYNQAYRGKHGYNEGGPAIFTDIPAGYVPLGGSPSPTQAAQNSVEASAAKRELTDPWVIVNPKTGALKFVNSPAPPRGALTSAGLPVTKSQFYTAWRNLNDIYFSYTGHQAQANAVANFLAHPVSTFALENRLSQAPGFVNSPLWKSSAPSYEGVWASIFGQNVKPDQEMIRYAIVHNVGGAGFQQLIRKSPAYLQSSEFKATSASLTNVYQVIFGNPDATGQAAIQQAALDGWTPDQFASHLRAQDEYKHSPEYHTKRLALLDSLGVLGASTPTLSADEAVHAGAQTSPPSTQPPSTPPTGAGIGR